jgi:hypothetical protein
MAVLWKDASLVMTDSGGLQEETTGFSPQALAFFLIVSPDQGKNLNNHFAPFVCPACPMEFSSFHSIGVKSLYHVTGAFVYPVKSTK